jgi:DNA-binding protein H-NS
MSDQSEKAGSSKAGEPKPSIRDAITQMAIPEIAALIEFAEQTRRQKLEKAKQDLLTEFQERASEIGLSLDSLVSQTRLPANKPKDQAGDGKKVAAKFRSPDGEEWSGRGRPPAWLTALEAQGKKKQDFAI